MDRSSLLERILYKKVYRETIEKDGKKYKKYKKVLRFKSPKKVILFLLLIALLVVVIATFILYLNRNPASDDEYRIEYLE